LPYGGFVYAALGLHPGTLDESLPLLDRDLRFIEDHLGETVGIGEVGLDYHKRVVARAGKEVQKDVFATVLRLAGRYNKPVIIHSRYAWRDCFTLTRAAGIGQAVFHWYTGPTNVLREILDRGYFVSATLAAEYHAEHRRAVKEAPLEQLLLETDAPVFYRGHQSEPADVVRSLQALAELKAEPPEVVAAATTANAVRLYGMESVVDGGG